MKKHSKNESPSPLDASLPNKFESKYLEKTKGLVASKSAKTIPTLAVIDNAFKKTNKKIQEADFKSKKTKMQAAKQASGWLSGQIRHQKKEINESNKFIIGENTRTGHNPQQFFVRNQLFEKQKQLKLQFERRKQLYGIASDAKFKPNLLTRQNQEIKDQTDAETLQKSKSYKQMYYKRYGKFKMEGIARKKKNKNYEQLMKQSIARFQQKFKELGGTSRNAEFNYFFNENNEKIEGFPSLSISNINENSLKQPFQSFNQEAAMPSMVEVDEKIKTLMRKLQIEDELSNSVDRNNQAGNMRQNKIGFDIKEQLQESGSIQKEDQHPKQKISHPFISSLSFILNEADQTELQEKQDRHPQELPNQSFPHQIFINDPTNPLKKKVNLQIQKVLESGIPPQLQEGRQTINLKEEEKNDLSQYSEQTIKTRTIEQISSHFQEQDIRVLVETSINNPLLQTLEFNKLSFLKIENLLQNVLKKSDQLPNDQNRRQVDYQTLQELQQQKQRIVNQEVSLKEKFQQNETDHKSTSENKPNIVEKQQVKGVFEELAMSESSQDYHYQTNIESFIDLNGNFVQNACIQVQHFGYCRFLVVDEASQRSSQTQNY